MATLTTWHTPTIPGSAHTQEDPPREWPEFNILNVIGISVAIAGNVLISLALNIQKLAHKRVELARIQRMQGRELRRPGTSGNGQVNGRRTHASRVEESEEDGYSNADSASHVDHSDGMPEDSVTEEPIVESPTRTSLPLRETDSLLPTTRTSSPSYGARLRPSNGHAVQPTAPHAPKSNMLSRLFSFRLRQSSAREAAMLPANVVTEATVFSGLANGRRSRNKNSPEDGDRKETDYLKSKLWWLGFFLMNLGEVGNFISYAFAPASVVAPLGTFALIANCVFAPLMLNERFRNRDLLGILIAIIGAVTVVLSSSPSDTRLSSEELMSAISQRIFIVYSCVYGAGAVILAILSKGPIGRKYVFVDVGLCAIFGGFTVLSTKGISTLLTLEWFEIFTEWITYPIVLVLLLTGVGQIRYLNKALMRFDSKVVIPIQFVLFNLSAIVGSAILFGDFKKATFHQFLTFIYGCIATFAGVFIIADGNANAANEVESENDTESGGNEAHIGGVSDRRRPNIAIPGRGQPALHHRPSSVGLGLSPAKQLLFAHNLPLENIDLRDTDRGLDSESDSNLGSFRRRRPLPWYGEHPHGIRDNSAIPRQGG